MRACGNAQPVCVYRLYDRTNYRDVDGEKKIINNLPYSVRDVLLLVLYQYILLLIYGETFSVAKLLVHWIYNIINIVKNIFSKSKVVEAVPARSQLSNINACIYCYILRRGPPGHFYVVRWLIQSKQNIDETDSWNIQVELLLIVEEWLFKGYARERCEAGWGRPASTVLPQLLSW